MAATLNITDGTTTVSLISASGFSVRDMPQSLSGLDMLTSRSRLADSRALNVVSRDAITETWECRLVATSHDNAASQFQVLQRLLIKAMDYHTTNWQTAPVYMTAKTKNETGTRYSLLLGGEVWPIGSWLEKPFDNANTWRVALTIMREPFWRDTQPGTLPSLLSLIHPDAANGTQQWVSNVLSTKALTHIYDYDLSLTTFSANRIASTAFAYFPAAPAVNDIEYFGSDTGPFYNLVLYIGVASVTNVTYIWEYWNGAWADATTFVSTSDLGVSGTRVRTGLNTVKFNAPADWTTTAINGVTAYWLRLRISAFTSWTTSPTQSTQVVYIAKNNYIEIASTILKGDLPSWLRLLLYASGSGTAGVSWGNAVIIGAKSRGLTTFVSRLNAGTDVDSNWTVSLGTDTAAATDARAPGASRPACTFATDQTMVSRVIWSNAANASSADFEGLYQVYAIVEQTTGTAGAVSVRMAIYPYNTTALARLTTDTVALTLVDNGKEIVDLGRLRIPPIGMGGTSMQLALALQASATSATPDLRIYELVLIPVDEWAMILRDPMMLSTNAYNSALYANTRLEVDAGIIRPEAAYKNMGQGANHVAGDFLTQVYRYFFGWEARGRLPEIMPALKTRLYFLFGSYPTDSTTSGALVEQVGMGAMLSAYAHQRWTALRGAE